MLNTSIEYLKGVGSAKADVLKKELGVFSYLQLLQHYPFRYVDKTKFHKVKDIKEEGDYVQVKGILRRIDSIGDGRKRRMTGVFRDDTGMLELTWFKGLSWVQNLQVGMEYIVYGKPTIYKGKVSIVHPDITLLTEVKKANASTLEPVYPTTDKLRNKRLDSKGMATVMKNLFIKIHPQRHLIPESLPDYLLESLRFPGRYATWMGIHFPRNKAQRETAQKRIKFEEFFFLQLRMLQTKHQKKIGIRGFIFPRIGAYFNAFYQNNLKFELTNAQKRVIKEIRADIATGQQMNRLLQGDVGSGKTIVGFMCILIAIDNGFQAALMAPTEILAQQHYQSILEMAEGLGITIGLLTGTVKGKKRKLVLEQLEAGEIDLLIGTHALIEDPVKFKNLGFVIVDEQHRFGVVQRSKMWRKNKTNPPHILVMTATPIPRTLAMTAYGDLDVSVIDEMPPGRKPINTFHKFESQRLWTFGQMKREIAKGHQVYIVYPLIEESEYEGLSEVKDLMEGYATIEREFPKPQYQISVVHGRQKPADKEAEMQRFARGETQILMATTVIEVGVNVPNASIMVIENAERFGLAQLHQLRGRVGRGGGDAYCILMTGFKLSSDGRFRMQTMVETTDGFKISEADLKLRGPGNIEGTQQSGVLNLKLADIVQDGDILRAARAMAKEILEEDPLLQAPKNARLLRQLQLSQRKHGFGQIS
ncbi:ATP-dependent DNA helicase RecG [Aureispira anguillae]|uniref:ATP-dependent DNA helicase RecG n=1 Tax=Aureispira anguillae TaxID=2864201 RepID=A0A915YKP1_9BACT|nr:ATP-dependent DNA helicase RecG [Aureispira anguillae]BDS14984.1 ATP-dependent DNA helicase RecG [Aureispira anguillae]